MTYIRKISVNSNNTLCSKRYCYCQWIIDRNVIEEYRRKFPERRESERWVFSNVHRNLK